MHEDALDRLLFDAIGREAAALAGEITRAQLAEGDWLSHYRIIAPIGDGGMGAVYKAYDSKLQRVVALKVLHHAPHPDARLRERLEHEARAASALDHPSICVVHDFDEVEGRRFIVMEYLTGVTLREHARDGLPERVAIQIGMAIASALKAAHQRHIVHCDIKPANIFITERGEVKVLDFGIARLRRGERQPPSTEPSSAAGTRHFMSPEQARGEAVDERTDIYALGAVLRSIVSAPSTGLSRVIARMTDPDKDRRYQSIRDARAALVTIAAARSRRPWLVAAAVALAILGTLGWSAMRAPILAERDWILVGDFENRTGDPAFDDVLGDVAAVQLSQSPYLIVYPEARLAEQLALMRRPADQRLTAGVAQEICERAGIKAFVTGAIVPVGSELLVRLDVVDARTGDYLAREQSEAADHRGVLRAVGAASTAVRRTLGESYQSIARFDVPAESATTASLEALRAFRLGQEQMRMGTSNALKAVPFFKRAIELDPEFALAHARLAVAYANARENKRSEEASRMAFQHRERVSTRERYEIETRYYDNVSGEISKAVESVEVWAKTFPTDPRPFNTLSAYYKNLGRLEEAAASGTTSQQLLPSSNIYRSNLAGAYFRLSLFDRAREICEQAIRDGLDNSTTHRFLQQIAEITGDAAMAGREAEWRARHTSDYAHTEYEASVAGAAGRLGDARRLYRDAIALAMRDRLTDRAAEYQMRLAWLEIFAGDAKAAAGIGQAVLSAEVGRLLRADAALALVAAGVPHGARELVRLESEFPDDEYLQDLWQPLVSAVSDLRMGRARQAIDALRPLEAYDRGDHALMRPSYYLGLACLAANDAAGARRAFQKIVDNRGVVANSALYAIAHVGLARAAALAGDVDGARRAYGQFFALWKDADPALPILIAARAEYARLISS
jgi:Flp pilus assembly protein TadD